MSRAGFFSQCRNKTRFRGKRKVGTAQVAPALSCRALLLVRQGGKTSQVLALSRSQQVRGSVALIFKDFLKPSEFTFL